MLKGYDECLDETKGYRQQKRLGVPGLQQYSSYKDLTNKFI